MNKKPRIYIQYPDDRVDPTLPSTIFLKKWIRLALRSENPAYEITLRFVDRAESQLLNTLYRQKQNPTNVLSFPMHETLEDGYLLLGDLAICVDLLHEESQAQQKTLDAHCAHLIIHGCLHLIGHDHEADDEAEIMESLEVQLLKQCHFNNPYILSPRSQPHG